MTKVDVANSHTLHVRTHSLAFVQEVRNLAATKHSGVIWVNFIDPWITNSIINIFLG